MNLPLKIELGAYDDYNGIIGAIYGYMRDHQDDVDNAWDVLADLSWHDIIQRFDEYTNSERVTFYILYYKHEIGLSFGVQYVLEHGVYHFINVGTLEDPFRFNTIKNMYTYTWMANPELVDMYNELTDSEKLFIELV